MKNIGFAIMVKVSSAGGCFTLTGSCFTLTGVEFLMRTGSC
jgi:hypothetical protein